MQNNKQYIIYLFLDKMSFTLVILALFITCSLASDKPTQAEIDMAEMMGITVEELRNQTPEEHMKMMQDMILSCMASTDRFPDPSFR